MNEIVEAAKEQRIVTMQDGSVVNFGVRGNVLQTIDAEAGTLEIKVITGEKITVEFNSLPENIKVAAALAGVYTRVKSGLTNTDEAEIAGKIQTAIDALLAGNWSSRGTSEDEVELTEEMKYFAIAAASFDKFPFYNAEFAPVVKKENGLLLWNDEVAQDIIEKISAIWDGFDRKQKNIVRKSQYFALVQGHGLQHLLSQVAV